MAKRPRRIWLYGAGNRMFCCAGRPNTCNNLSLLQAEASERPDDLAPYVSSDSSEEAIRDALGLGGGASAA